jgi:hypothetical protein
MRTQWGVTIATTIDPVANTDRFGSLPMRLAPVGLIAKDFFFLAMQQCVHLVDISRIRGRRLQRVYDSAPVSAHMRLHPEVPFFAFDDLVHFRIALTVRVLRRGGRLNDRCIHDRARLQQQSLIFQQLTDMHEDPLGQPMLLEQPSETQNRRLIRNRSGRPRESLRSPPLVESRRIMRGRCWNVKLLFRVFNETELR